MIMHDIICSNIRIAELKLKRVRLEKEHLLDNKPFILNKKKLKKWNMELERIKQEEYIILDELDKAYKALEEYI